RREGRCKGTLPCPGQGPSTPGTGRRRRASKRARSSKRTKGGREMKLLTPEEQKFLDVFLHEATTAPFTRPGTKALHAIGVEYGDISYLAWAYEQEVPRTGFSVGHAADVVPPLPWPDRQAALRRNQELRRVWEQRRQRDGAPSGQNGGGRSGEA